MQKIFEGKKILGIKISSIPPRSVPLTEGSEPLQLVTLGHPAGTKLVAHKHTPKKRVTSRLQECLVVIKGKIRVDIYGASDKKVKHIFLKRGEAYIVMDGGIGVFFNKDSEVMEFKNGPFVEDKVNIGDEQ